MAEARLRSKSSTREISASFGYLTAGQSGRDRQALVLTSSIEITTSGSCERLARTGASSSTGDADLLIQNMTAKGILRETCEEEP